jgi:hypothetical protein
MLVLVSLPGCHGDSRSRLQHAVRYRLLTNPGFPSSPAADPKAAWDISGKNSPDSP